MKVEKVLTITRKERKEMIRVRKKLTEKIADFFEMSVKELVKDEGFYEFHFDVWLTTAANDKKWGSEQFTEIYKYLKSHVFNYGEFPETMIGYLIRNLGDRHYERRGIFNSKILISVESTPSIDWKENKMKRRLLTLVEYIIYLIYKISYAIFCRVERKSSNNYIVLEIYCSIYKSTRAICRRMAEKHTELCNKIMHEYEKYENKKSEV